MSKTNGKDLIAIIDGIVNKNVTSPKLQVVQTATKNLQGYIDQNKNVTNKPDDLARVRAALTHLKDAEKEFETKEKDIYSSGAARNAAKKVLQWCAKNSENAIGVKKAANFAEQVEKHNKKPKTATVGKIGAYSLDTAHKALDAIRDKLPAGKKEIQEALEAKAEKVMKGGKEKLEYLGKAVSGVVTDITRAGQDDKCDTVTVDKKKYNKKG